MLKDKKVKRIEVVVDDNNSYYYDFKYNNIEKSTYKLNRLVRYYTLNSKQIHGLSPSAGRTRTSHPSGTGKGKSRQPRDARGKVVGVPNAVGGRVAHGPRIVSKKIKITKKELKDLKENALSIILRLSTTKVINLKNKEIKGKLKDDINLIGSLSRKVTFVSDKVDLISSIRNHPKINTVKGLRYDFILKGGIKDKIFIIDIDTIERYLCKKE
jgi:ribosomal protein L4